MVTLAYWLQHHLQVTEVLLLPRVSVKKEPHIDYEVGEISSVTHWEK